MIIRRFKPTDADAVVRVSELATRITSGAVYDQAFVEEMVAKQTRDYFLRRGEQMHFYVACEDDDTVIGCAAIGPYHKTSAESCLYSVFVLPEKQKRGVGRAPSGTPGRHASPEPNSPSIRSRTLRRSASPSGGAFPALPLLR